MDWKAALQQERAALMRLAALLHALASLAERAAGRSAAMRGVVLWLLRHAGSIAHQFVISQFAPHQPAAGQFVIGQFAPGQFTDPFHEHAAIAAGQSGNRPEDAMRLAACLRALAWHIEARVAQLSCHGGGRLEKIAPARRPASLKAAVLQALFGPAPDTS
jgi:hypothetical protein